MDYQSNSKKDREKAEEKPEKKSLEKVTTGEVLVKKKTLGQKLKDVFIAVDIKNVTSYVVYDICIPAFQNMLVDGVSKGIERMTFGARPRGGYQSGPRTTYNRPVNRGYGFNRPYEDNLDRKGLPGRQEPRTSRAQLNTDIVLSTRAEAEFVLEQMINCVDQYDVVTVGDLNDLVGLKGTPVDEKWGWLDLGEAEVRHIREGYLIDLPQAQPLQ